MNRCSLSHSRTKLTFDWIKKLRYQNTGHHEARTQLETMLSHGVSLETNEPGSQLGFYCYCPKNNAEFSEQRPTYKVLLKRLWVQAGQNEIKLLKIKYNVFKIKSSDKNEHHKRHHKFKWKWLPVPSPRNPWGKTKSNNLKNKCDINQPLIHTCTMH